MKYYIAIAATVLAMFILNPTPGAQAQSAANQLPPGIVERGPGVYSFNVGDVRVTAQARLKDDISPGTINRDLAVVRRILNLCADRARVCLDDAASGSAAIAEPSSC